ncbi:MAG: PA2169 family four-helix-bundle protein [Saprospiraceae bacterium]|jgi:uncharacterized protein (TIGR02284 family)|nr:PA2169 family four-helix-bundle protein [Saprospiraceae bacterium]
MKNEETIAVLNTLIQINNDRIEGYDTASKETEEQDLKAHFNQFTMTSQKCKQALVEEVTRLGGEPTESTRVSGKFFRVWMDVKSAITNKDRKAILGSCEYGENVADETYQDVLKNESEHLMPPQQTMINAQHVLLNADRALVKSMHDALEKAA